jgi:3-phosphoshikimate 1-carboxyvinyltransferase
LSRQQSVRELQALLHILPQVSMQLVSGLMFALPLLNEDSKIIFMQSVNTANTDMTKEVMTLFGVQIDKTDYGYYIEGKCKDKTVFNCVMM